MCKHISLPHISLFCTYDYVVSRNTLFFRLNLSHIVHWNPYTFLKKQTVADKVFIQQEALETSSNVDIANPI